MNKTGLSIAILLISSSVSAASISEYHGHNKRHIKALSPEKVQGLLNGHGMGYARPAELNHYPGPKHVLELVDELKLTKHQQEESQAIFKKMQAQAIKLGKELVAREKQLDQAFADGSIDKSTLSKMLNEIGQLQASLRNTHIAAHLDEAALLSPEQIKRYDELRGYTDEAIADHSSHSVRNHQYLKFVE